MQIEQGSTHNFCGWRPQFQHSLLILPFSGSCVSVILVSTDVQRDCPATFNWFCSLFTYSLCKWERQGFPQCRLSIIMKQRLILIGQSHQQKTFPLYFTLCWSALWECLQVPCLHKVHHFNSSRLFTTMYLVSEFKITSSTTAFLTSPVELSPTLNLDSIGNYNFLITFTFIIACLMSYTDKWWLSWRQDL